MSSFAARSAARASKGARSACDEEPAGVSDGVAVRPSRRTDGCREDACCSSPTGPCNAPDTPAGVRYSWRDLDWPHRSILVFSTHFVLTHAHPGATSRSVTHLDTTPS